MTSYINNLETISSNFSRRVYNTSSIKVNNIQVLIPKEIFIGKINKIGLQKLVNNINVAFNKAGKNTITAELNTRSKNNLQIKIYNNQGGRIHIKDDLCLLSTMYLTNKLGVNRDAIICCSVSQNKFRYESKNKYLQYGVNDTIEFVNRSNSRNAMLKLYYAPGKRPPNKTNQKKVIMMN